MNIFLSKKFLLPTIIIGIIYIVTATYLMNYRLVSDALLGTNSITYKVTLLFALLQGMWTAMSTTSLLLLIFTAFFTGAAITLVVVRFLALQKIGSVHLMAGGGSLLGVLGSGCAACGLPIISLLGLTGSIFYLPFHGTELSYIAVCLLGISLYFLMKSTLQDRKSCSILKGK